jgi:hypothetical protein
MTLAAVKAVIAKAIEDSEFREALFANPEETLAAHDLSESEVAALRSIDAETMESLAGSVDERVSKALFAGFHLGAAAATREVPAGPGWMGVEEGM